MSVPTERTRAFRGTKVAAEDANIGPVADTCADYERKTKKQLFDEIADLRRRIRGGDATDSAREAIESELKGTRQRLQYLLAVSPAIIYTNKASGDFSCTFVSENLCAIMETHRSYSGFH